MTERARAIAESERRSRLLGEVTMARLSVLEAQRRYNEAVAVAKHGGLSGDEVRSATQLADRSQR